MTENKMTSDELITLISSVELDIQKLDQLLETALTIEDEARIEAFFCNLADK